MTLEERVALEREFHRQLDEFDWDRGAYIHPWPFEGSVKLDGDFTIKQLENLITVYRRVFGEFSKRCYKGG